MASSVAPAPPSPEPQPARAPIAAPIAAAAVPATDPRCANCGTRTGDHFCPHCGQEQADLHRSLRSVFGELLDSLAGWDGKIPATLWLLVRHPGALTAEFLAGRRARYLRPLRLYLTLSLVFFLALRWGGDDSNGAGPRVSFDGASGAPVVLSGGDRAARVRSVARAAAADAAAARGDSLADSLARRVGAIEARSESRPVARGSGGVGSRIEQAFKSRKARWDALPSAQRSAAFKAAFVSQLGNMIFALVPVFAVLLRVAYWRAPFYVAEHFVHALHLHALGMGAMTAAALISPSAWAGLPLVALPVYAWRSFRRVYGGSALRTTLKLVFVSGMYAIALLVALTATAVLIYLFTV